MDTDVVVGAIVVIGRHATPNKDASNVNKCRKIIVYELSDIKVSYIYNYWFLNSKYRTFYE